MSRYGDLEKLKNHFNFMIELVKGDVRAEFESTNNLTIKVLESVCEDIDKAPTADVAPVIHAHWELWDHEEASTTLRCSRCGREVEHKGSYDEIKDVFPYCHCGAKMDEESII